MSGRRPFSEMADRLNRMKPGEAMKISRDEINMLPSLPPWAAMADITVGFERVKESVIGSGLPDVWRFDENPFTGDVTAYRLPNKRR